MRLALIVDNPYRDLSGICLTALHLAQQKVTCFLVPWNLRSRELWTLAPDFVLLNYLRKNNQDLVRRLLNAGIKVGVLDTEGGVLVNADEYANTMATDVATRHEISKIFMWGARLADHAVENNWYLAQQVTVTGHPRFDFYANPWRDAALAASAFHMPELPGPMVLINGSFALVNAGFQTADQEMRMLIDKFGYDETEVQEWMQREQTAFEGMIHLTNQLAARFPKVTFVCRPHPFERMETYSAMLEQRDNLRLIRQGTVDSWILRAKGIIHRGSSTAIEAGIAGVPALSPAWLPSIDWLTTAANDGTVDSVSLMCETPDVLFEHLNAALDDSLSLPDAVRINLDKVVEDWFYKIDGLAHQRVVNGLLETIEEDPPNVSLDYCSRSAYGSFSQPTPQKRFRTAARKALRMPIDWSGIRLWRNLRPLPWDSSDKHFDTQDVRKLVASIEPVAAENYAGRWRPVTVWSAKERGEYRVPYVRGRSVVVEAR